MGNKQETGHDLQQQLGVAFYWLGTLAIAAVDWIDQEDPNGETAAELVHFSGPLPQTPSNLQSSDQQS